MKRYAESHEWIEITSATTARIGISDYAQSELGDVVFVDLPELDTQFDAGDEFAAVESVKAASEIYLPIAGTVIAVNEALEDEPNMVNTSAEKDGWLIEISFEGDAEQLVEALMDETAYSEANPQS
ncbi:MAG: glycine cleavage system protein GcvH [Alphaproteobacteria bacterium]|nr:glycine cleavage system protein GcvH [Alphaproteobacteria bacterium]